MLNMHVDPNQHKDKYISVPDCCRSSKFFIEKIANKNIMCTLVCGPTFHSIKKQNYFSYEEEENDSREKEEK